MYTSVSVFHDQQYTNSAFYIKLHILSGLTPVSSVSVDYTCYTNTVTVSWSVVLGADSYIASAVDENATEVLCTSQGVSCQISGLRCGQNYVVRVTPASANCRNLVNATSASFQTGETQKKHLLKSLMFIITTQFKMRGCFFIQGVCRISMILKDVVCH